MDRPADNVSVVPKRIVLVHHNALIREGLRRILESDGFRVVWQQGDGAGLVELLAAKMPDLVLVAWEAPGIEASLLEELAAAQCETPVAIITQPGTHHDLASVRETRVAGCLSVNMGASEFLAAVRLLAQGDLLVSHDMVLLVTGSSHGQLPEQRLTSRELEVLRALGRGATNRQIANELLLSPHTVKIHVHQVLVKMGFRNRQQATAYAAGKGIV